MKEFFFKLFRLEWEPAPCETCEVLKLQLALEREEKKKLLDLILNKDEKVEAPQTPETPVRVTRSSYIPWSVRRQMLEEESRNKTREKEITENLEKELGIPNGETADKEILEEQSR